MRPKTTLAMLALTALALGGVVLAQSRGPRHDAPPSPSGNLVVALCDGETAAEVPGVKEGETPTPEQARAVVDRLMTDWRRKHPDAEWDGQPLQLAQADKPETERPPQEQGENRPHTESGPVQEGHTYGAFTERDEAIWKAETDRFVKQGHDIFHDAKAFGGTIGVSCDMCHPDAANTHPETYPKFQVQLGRVALLRDMINWCIQNPTRGTPLADDDPRLKAMEAYILAQRKGTGLEFGKH
jgi:thiosulfate dehydrogenase